MSDANVSTAVSGLTMNHSISIDSTQSTKAKMKAWASVTRPWGSGRARVLDMSMSIRASST